MTPGRVLTIFNCGDYHSTWSSFIDPIESLNAAYDTTVALMGFAQVHGHRTPITGRVLRADQLAVRLPKQAWQRLSAGPGAKGHGYHDWAWVTICGPRPGCRWLLTRRNRSAGELAYYRCHTHSRFPLPPGGSRGLLWTVRADDSDSQVVGERAAELRHQEEDQLSRAAAVGVI